ncbi:unnamed protein product [Knipowitschia caucasica]|uniref:C-type lectin domain-containing protein n=1 Tax=Knipowitschia caucasica TaxID=637954 RepID=A0AAV2ME82_KNICA
MRSGLRIGHQWSPGTRRTVPPSAPATDCTETLRASCYRESDQTYWILDQSLDWKQARSQCKANFANLSSVLNQNQTQDILQALQSLNQAGEEVWIGLYLR